MTFYRECLGGELVLQAVEGSPIEDQCPVWMKHQILHASLQRGTLLLMGSDMQAPGGDIQGNAVALSLNCGSEAEIHHFWNRLSAGGEVLDPLGVKFWGALFGVVTDKFGFRWMLNYDKATQP